MRHRTPVLSFLKHLFTMKPILKKTTIVSLLASFFPWVLYAQDAPPAHKPFSFDLNTILLIIAALLAIPLVLVAQTFVMSAQKMAKEKAKAAGKNISLLLLFMLGSQLVSAQVEVAPVQKASLFVGFDAYTWALLFVIALEVILFIFFSRNLLRMLAPEKETTQPSAFASWWEKINNFRPIEQETDLDTGHNYDGIRELDNITPPWFTLAFGFSILFAFVYMYRYHVAKASPLMIEEYNMEVAKAEAAEYVRLAQQANKVDENNIQMLSDAEIAMGKGLFTEKCKACHGDNGASMPGGVGPNLTDDHWLHGGSLKDIFKTIKYGVPAKGMIAWQDQLSASQIAQLTSYIKSIKGTVSSGGKEPQGDLFNEGAAPTATQDTVKTN